MMPSGDGTKRGATNQDILDAMEDQERDCHATARRLIDLAEELARQWTEKGRAIQSLSVQADRMELAATRLGAQADRLLRFELGYRRSRMDTIAKIIIAISGLGILTRLGMIREAWIWISGMF